MIQLLRTHSKLIGGIILAIVAAGAIYTPFAQKGESGTGTATESPQSTAVKPGPVAPVVYHFDESTQSWVSPGHPPIPVKNEQDTTQEGSSTPAPTGNAQSVEAPLPQEAQDKANEPPLNVVTLDANGVQGKDAPLPAEPAKAQ